MWELSPRAQPDIGWKTYPENRENGGFSFLIQTGTLELKRSSLVGGQHGFREYDLTHTFAHRSSRERATDVGQSGRREEGHSFHQRKEKVMEGFTQSLILLGGVLLRFGLPILGTGILVYLLKQIDRRWQEEGVDRGEDRDVYAAAEQKPCWEQRGCSAERRAACPAYQHTGQPCWQFARETSGHLKAECLTCDVFINFPNLAPA